MFCKDNIHNIKSILTINLYLLTLYALVYYALSRNGLPILHCR